jgi:hypothetical protein
MVMLVCVFCATFFPRLPPIFFSRPINPPSCLHIACAGHVPFASLLFNRARTRCISRFHRHTITGSFKKTGRGHLSKGEDDVCTAAAAAIAAAMIQGQTFFHRYSTSRPLLLPLLLLLPLFLLGAGTASFGFRGGRPALVRLPFPFPLGRGRNGDVPIVHRHQIGLFLKEGGREGWRVAWSISCDKRGKTSPHFVERIWKTHLHRYITVCLTTKAADHQNTMLLRSNNTIRQPPTLASLPIWVLPTSKRTPPQNEKGPLPPLRRNGKSRRMESKS